MKIKDIIAVTAGNTIVRLVACAGRNNETFIQGKCADIFRVHRDYIQKTEVEIILFSVEVIEGSPVLVIRYSC